MSRHGSHNVCNGSVRSHFCRVYHILHGEVTGIVRVSDSISFIRKIFRRVFHCFVDIETAAAEEDKILSGVTFALSGFKNPYRAELRDKATALGARYAPDWGPSCTHLM